MSCELVEADGRRRVLPVETEALTRGTPAGEI
jgi:hypothetical protein